VEEMVDITVPEATMDADNYMKRSAEWVGMRSSPTYDKAEYEIRSENSQEGCEFDLQFTMSLSYVLHMKTAFYDKQVDASTKGYS
jgi:hypothetical protein